MKIRSSSFAIFTLKSLTSCLSNSYNILFFSVPKSLKRIILPNILKHGRISFNTAFFFFHFRPSCPCRNITQLSYLHIFAIFVQLCQKYVYLLRLCWSKIRSYFKAGKKVTYYIMYTMSLFKTPFGIKYIKFLNRSSKPLRRHSQIPLGLRVPHCVDLYTNYVRRALP